MPLDGFSHLPGHTLIFKQQGTNKQQCELYTNMTPSSTSFFVQHHVVALLHVSSLPWALEHGSILYWIAWHLCNKAKSPVTCRYSVPVAANPCSAAHCTSAFSADLICQIVALPHSRHMRLWGSSHA